MTKGGNAGRGGGRCPIECDEINNLGDVSSSSTYGCKAVAVAVVEEDAPL
jgi:hypothetical protein